MKKHISKITAKSKSLDKMLSFVYGRYNNIRYRKKCKSRIKEINPEKFFDISNKPDKNVIILTIDCLRNSQLSYKGYQRETTPFLDTFKSKFNSISTSSWTYPSVTSILTGLYPHNHGAFIEGKIKNFDNIKSFRKIRKNILTLPEIFFLLGYRTYFGTAVDMAFYPLQDRAIPRIYYSLNADSILSDLTKWISKDDKQFFAYVQLGDIHEPLTPPKNFQHFLGTVKDIANVNRWDYKNLDEQNKKDFKDYKENRILLYDNTLRYIDCSIEKFYKILEEKSILDSTLLIVTADHGEEFWEHTKLEEENFFDPRGYYGVGHGHNNFNEIIEVPLLISAPNLSTKKSNYLIGGIDIVPTIIDFIGIDYYPKLDGQNVFKIYKNRPLLSEAIGYGYEKKSLIIGNYKLIYSEDDGVKWLFNLKKDYEEQYPIIDEKVTSIFIEKLNKILIEDEKRKVKKIINKNIKL